MDLIKIGKYIAWDLLHRPDRSHLPDLADNRAQAAVPACSSGQAGWVLRNYNMPFYIAPFASFPAGSLFREILPVIRHCRITAAKTACQCIICCRRGNVTHTVIAHAQLDRRQIVTALLPPEALVGLVTGFDCQMIPECCLRVLLLLQKQPADLAADLLWININWTAFFI